MSNKRKDVSTRVKTEEVKKLSILQMRDEESRILREVGERVKLLLKKKGMPLDKLCKAAKLCSASITNVMRGIYAVAPKTFARVLFALKDQDAAELNSIFDLYLEACVMRSQWRIKRWKRYAIFSDD